MRSGSRRAEGEPEQAPIIEAQARATNLLRRVTDNRVSFERLAWFALWSKGFRDLTAVGGVSTGLSGHVLEILWRSTFETELHVLWHDKRWLVDLLNRRTLDQVWSSQPARAIMNDLEELRLHESIFGVLNVETREGALQRGRRQQEDHGRRELQRIDRWLGHSDLQQWTDRISGLSQSRSPAVSFYSLFDEAETSTATRLSSLGMRFAYSEYIRTSNLLHGSTIREVLDTSEGVTPRIATARDEIAAMRDQSACAANRLFALLFMVQERLWPEGRGEE